MKILFVWPNKDVFGIKPLGLSLLSAIAKKQGCETRLFDTTRFDFGLADNNKAGEDAKLFKPVELEKYGHKKVKLDLEKEFLNAVSGFKPDLIAFSVLNDEYPLAEKISDIAKKKFIDARIIWGGKFPTICPEKALSVNSVDYICVGEGIEAFRDLIRVIGTKGDAAGINNIWTKSNGRIIKAGLRPLKQALDDLPYLDWDIFEQHHFYRPFDGKVYKGGDHMLNWGCPKHCTYCNNDFFHSLYENKYFMRSYGIPRIIKELKYLKEKFSLEYFNFLDEDFLLRPAGELRELSQAYSKEIGLPNTIMTNPKSVTEEKAGFLKDMNCVSASLGIEIGDDQLRDKLLKRVDSKNDIITAFSLLRDKGIRTSSLNMLGLPFETRKSYFRTVDINRECQAQYPYIGFFYPFEGTQLREVSVKNGFFDDKGGKYIPYFRDRPALKFDNLTEEELVEMRNVFVLYVKLPKDYYPFIERSEKNDLIGRKMRKKLLEIYDKTVWINDGYFIDDGNGGVYIRSLNSISAE